MRGLRLAQRGIRTKPRHAIAGWLRCGGKVPSRLRFLSAALSRSVVLANLKNRAKHPQATCGRIRQVSDTTAICDFWRVRSMSNRPRSAGRHFLQIPGPTPIPDRVLRAIDMPIIDHRGPEFQRLAKRVLEKVKGIFKTQSKVIIFPASGTGGWEAALVNTLSPGDRVLMFESGQFAALWKAMALRLGLKPEFI